MFAAGRLDIRYHASPLPVSNINLHTFLINNKLIYGSLNFKLMLGATLNEFHRRKTELTNRTRTILRLTRSVSL